MEGDVSVELIEEGNSVTNQDRHDRVTNFVGQPETKAFAGNDTAANEPDAPEPRAQAAVHERRKIPRVELDVIPRSRQITTGEDKSGFVAVRPSHPLGFKIQRGLIGFRSHDIAVDRVEESLDDFIVQSLTSGEF